MRLRRKSKADDLVVFCTRCNRRLWTVSGVDNLGQAKVLVERILSLHNCKRGRHER